VLGGGFLCLCWGGLFFFGHLAWDLFFCLHGFGCKRVLWGVFFCVLSQFFWHMFLAGVRGVWLFFWLVVGGGWGGFFCVVLFSSGGVGCGFGVLGEDLYFFWVGWFFLVGCSPGGGPSLVSWELFGWSQFRWLSGFFLFPSESGYTLFPTHQLCVGFSFTCGPDWFLLILFWRPAAVPGILFVGPPDLVGKFFRVLFIYPPGSPFSGLHSLFSL